MNALEQARRRFPKETIDINGTSVEIVRTHGAGNPLVMLPGAQGTAESFSHQLLAFGHQRDMICINYPGLETLPAVVDLVLALLEHLGVDRFDMVGTSLGGYLAQWIAAGHSDRVGKAVIGNSFADPRLVQSTDKLAALEVKSAEQLKLEVVERLLASADSEFRTIMLDLVGLRQTAEQLRNRMLLVQRAGVLDSPISASTPVLLIECDNDPLIAPPVREAIRRNHSHAQWVQISSGGHYPFMLKSDAYNQALGDFLGLG